VTRSQHPAGIINVPIAGGLHTENWRLAMRTHVLPGTNVTRTPHAQQLTLLSLLVAALHAFAPSIIFISAGFDAADGDENNYGMCVRRVNTVASPCCR
jgi:acetoin utilization deacetylase AcuC-like enzyme